jgi:hypothetical protein
MCSLLRVLTLAVLLLPLGACGGGETTPLEGAAGAAETVNEAATTAAAEVAEVLCCNGKCDAPAGYCCSDGTCHDSHAALPLASAL